MYDGGDDGGGGGDGGDDGGDGDGVGGDGGGGPTAQVHKGVLYGLERVQVACTGCQLPDTFSSSTTSGAWCPFSMIKTSLTTMGPVKQCVAFEQTVVVAGSSAPMYISPAASLRPPQYQSFVVGGGMRTALSWWNLGSVKWPEEKALVGTSGTALPREKKRSSFTSHAQCPPSALARHTGGGGGAGTASPRGGEGGGIGACDGGGEGGRMGEGEGEGEGGETAPA